MSLVVLILELIPVALDFVKWLEALLEKHVGDFYATGDDAADARTLLACVLADPELDGHPVRWAMVRILYHDGPAAIAAKSKLPAADAGWLAGLAALAG